MSSPTTLKGMNPCQPMSPVISRVVRDTHRKPCSGSWEYTRRTYSLVWLTRTRHSIQIDESLCILIHQTRARLVRTSNCSRGIPSRGGRSGGTKPDRRSSRAARRIADTAEARSRHRCCRHMPGSRTPPPTTSEPSCAGSMSRASRSGTSRSRRVTRSGGCDPCCSGRIPPSGPVGRYHRRRMEPRRKSLPKNGCMTQNSGLRM